VFSASIIRDQNIRHNNSENSHLHTHRRENLKSHQNMEHAQAMILENFGVSVEKIAAKPGVSAGSTSANVHNELEFDKMDSRPIYGRTQAPD
jgi:hypothetical protein